jgi:hypothetical protein
MLTLDKPLATVYYDCNAVMIDSNAPSHIKQHCEKRKNDNLYSEGFKPKKLMELHF